MNSPDGWGERGKRFFVASSSPGLSAKVSFYGLYLYNEGQVRLWPYARANGEHTVDVLHRLRAEIPDGKLIVVWDGAPYHRARAVWAEAASLGIELAPLPGYSPDLMPVEALWRWLREDVTYHHCHATADDLTRRVAAFEVRVNHDPCAVADRLWVKDHLNPDEEKLRFSSWTRFSLRNSSRCQWPVAGYGNGWWKTGESVESSDRRDQRVRLSLGGTGGRDGFMITPIGVTSIFASG